MGKTPHVVDVSIREQPGAAGDDRHDCLPERLAGRVDRHSVLLGRGLGFGRLLSSEVEHDAAERRRLEEAELREGKKDARVVRISSRMKNFRRDESRMARGLDKVFIWVGHKHARRDAMLKRDDLSRSPRFLRSFTLTPDPTFPPLPARLPVHLRHVSESLDVNIHKPSQRWHVRNANKSYTYTVAPQ